MKKKNIADGEHGDSTLKKTHRDHHHPGKKYKKSAERLTQAGCPPDLIVCVFFFFHGDRQEPHEDPGAGIKDSVWQFRHIITI